MTNPLAYSFNLTCTGHFDYGVGHIYPLIEDKPLMHAAFATDTTRFPTQLMAVVVLVLSVVVANEAMP